MPALSVIVPTYNRADYLDATLRTLGEQDVEPGEMEVIVIDDGSTDATADVAAAYPVRYAHQENSGLNAGRNRGAEEATAPLLAYLDDDVYVRPGWARAVLAGFAAHPDAVGIAGRVELRFEAQPPPWLTEGLHGYLSALELGPRARWLDPPETPRGANFGLRREVWAKAGGFVSGLDRRGASLLSNGENELFLRLYRDGGRVWWEPFAAVEHRVHPERATRDWFKRRARAQGVGDVMLEEHGTDGPVRRAGLIGREVLRLARTGPILAKGVVKGTGTVHAAVWAQYCVGRITELAKAG